MNVYIVWDDRDYYVAQIISVHASRENAERARSEWLDMKKERGVMCFISEHRVLP